MSEALKHAFKPYAQPLSQVREKMREVLHSLGDAETLRQVDYFQGAGGHMLRPTLILLIYGLLENREKGEPQKGESLHTLAAAIELLHTASLVHDDVLDESPTRRGQPTLHRKIGNHGAVLVGNLFYIAAFRLIMGFEDKRYVDGLMGTAEAMCIGEIHQHALEGRALTEESYLDIIERKTGRLVATAAALSARLAGASESEIDSFRDFGLLLGILYQLKDDADDDDIGNLSYNLARGLKAKKSEEMRVFIQKLKFFPDTPGNSAGAALISLAEYLMQQCDPYVAAISS